ncbi:DUF423 domain-containing protein [Neisseriaceae bacterium PsAf]|nr:DUF423 domain-containing protein [Neisseriaceae bacterium PsAf]
MSNEIILLIAGLLGATGIILGAFGAHALKKVFNAEQLISYEVGVRYQIYHALLLLFVSTTTLISPTQKNWIVCLVVLGVLMFSGSIYVLNLSQSRSNKLKFLWPVTPIGGTLLIISWFLVAFSAFWNN